MDFNNNEIRRYARQLALPEVGREGQKKLRQASVLCVGAGGLGCPALLYLTAAGLGRIGIVDFDRVDLTNLHRQVLFGSKDLGQLKTEAARDVLCQANPEVEIVLHSERLTEKNALAILASYDVVVDGTDNFPARYLSNDACFFLNKPLIYGSISRFEGQASVFGPALGAPCYRCLHPHPPPPGTIPNCAEAGVLGVLPGLIGSIQATETLKLVLGIGEMLTGRLLWVNALEMRWRELKIRRDPQCPLCGENPSITRLIEAPAVCALREPREENPKEVSVQEMKRALENPQLGIQVVDVRESYEAQLVALSGAVLLPLSSLQQRYTELNPSQELYLFCKAGVRSLHAVDFLRKHGFPRVRSVRGGLLAWGEEIDPTLSRY